MTPEMLEELIRNHESDHVELTVSRTDTEKFSEAVCAFSNDLSGSGRPGYLIIGVSDDKHFSGIAVTDQLLQSLGGLRADGNIQPLPQISVEKVVTSKGEAAVVTVYPSMLPPVYYKGRVCIRVGPRRSYATEQEERVLIERRVSQAKTFDAQPCLGSTLDDLSQALFSIDYRPRAVGAEVIAENHRSLRQQLAALRFFDLRNDCPANAGILLFGLDVRRWMPGAYVQFLRIHGTSLTDQIGNEREIDGDLLAVLRELDALVEANLEQFPDPQTSLREQIVEAYPRVAVRELLMNAVMHRDYEATSPLRMTWFDDRLEIQSPGGLYGEASPANFPTQTSYRNPVIAEAMKALGYVNRYGRGVLRAQAALEKNGSRRADFVLDVPGYVQATIWRRQ